MAEVADLTKLMQKQQDEYRQQQDEQRKQLEEQRKQQEEQRKQLEEHRQQQHEKFKKQQEDYRRQQDERMEENKKLMELLLQSLQQKQETAATAVPAFPGFDPTAELITDYIGRFNTFIAANSIHQDKIASTFLTNQHPTLYEQLSNMAAQLSTPKQINDLNMDKILEFLKDQYDPKRFIVRER